jgi:ssDNA thymidine ADP-ribosyltransferase, DarT
MNRADVTELHYITAIANLPSILRHGILSHNLAAKVAHDSVAMQEIQERRQNKRIPGAGYLHDYANLYFDAHNPMLSKCRTRNDEICVLQIEPGVLDTPGVIIADRNAASNWTSFWPVTEGLSVVSAERVFARYWLHPNDLYDEMSHKSEKCAEVLVPDRVDGHLIFGVYVANPMALLEFQRLESQLPVSIRGDMFF